MFPDKKNYSHLLRGSNRTIRISTIFYSKLISFWKLPQGAILCTIDVVCLYLNISHREGLTSLQIFLELRNNERLSFDTLLKLAEIVLITTLLYLMKKLLNSNVEPQSEQRLHLHVLFCLWLT